MKQAYEKAKAHVVLFDNSDVITTSGDENGKDKPNKKPKDCETHSPGTNRGIGCKNPHSGACPTSQAAG